MSLRYFTARIESFYQSLAADIANLAKQYYRASQFLRITDEMTGIRWVEINKPMEMFTGKMDAKANQYLSLFLWKSLIQLMVK